MNFHPGYDHAAHGVGYKRHCDDAFETGHVQELPYIRYTGYMDVEQVCSYTSRLVNFFAYTSRLVNFFAYRSFLLLSCFQIP